MAPWCPLSAVDTPASAEGQGRTEVPFTALPALAARLKLLGWPAHLSTSSRWPPPPTQRAAYDVSGRLTSIEGTKGTTVLSRFAYAYSRWGSDSGLRQSVTDNDNRLTACSYDALDRLAQAKTTSSSGAFDDAADEAVQGSGSGFSAGVIVGCGIGLVAEPPGCIAAGGALGTNAAVVSAVGGAAPGAFFGDRK